MQQPRTYCFSAFALALLIFITSLGLSLDVHYCGGKAKSWSLFGKAKTCIEKMGKSEAVTQHCAALPTTHPVLQKQKCCHNRGTLLKTDAVQISTSATAPSTSVDVLAFTEPSIWTPIISSFERLSIPFLHYKPPLLSKDYAILFDQFLL